MVTRKTKARTPRTIPKTGEDLLLERDGFGSAISSFVRKGKKIQFVSLKKK